jgi:hypothetical protein
MYKWLCNSITPSRHIFADHNKVFRNVSPATDCVTLLPDNDPIRGWCTTNHKKLSTYNTRVIILTWKNNAFNSNYKLCDDHTTSNDSKKDLGVFSDSKPFFFHCHVVYILSHSEGCDSHILLTLCYSNTDCLSLLNYTLVRPNNITHLSRITLRLLIPISWHATNGNLQHCASVTFFLISHIIILLRIFYSPTDAQVNCLKNNFQIYIKIDIKTAPTCFDAITIIRERIIRATPRN